MVLVDDDQTPKGVPLLSASVAGSSPESQPLLGTSRDHPILDAEAGLADAEVPPPYSAATPLLLAHNQARWRARGRFVQALLLGFVIWLGAALVLGRLTYTLDSEERGDNSGRDNLPSPPGTPQPSGAPSPPPPGPRPPNDVPYAYCVPASHWAGQDMVSSTHIAYDTFELRADAQKLSLTADALVGVATFRTHTGPAGANIQLYARARYRDKSMLDRIEACVRQNGTGIDFRANADDRKSGDPPQLELDVVFPAHVGGATAPRAFGALRTQFAMLHTYFGALDALRFDDVFFESANGAVRVEYLAARNIMVHTLTGAINGTFNATDAVSLFSSVAGIDARIDLFSAGTNSTLTLETTNGAIQSDIRLHSSQPDHRGGAFNVRAESANGHISTAVRALPLDARLAFEAQNLVGDIELALPTTFEGVFKGGMTVGRPEIVMNDYVTDPAGEHRTRWTSSKVIGGAFGGTVHWLPRHDDAPESTVRLETSTGGIRLQV